MKMEVLPSTVTFSDGDIQDMEQLLDMFGSVVSLHDIASAYCQAERDLQTASDILCSLEGVNSDTLSPDDQDGSLHTSSNESSESVSESAPLASQSRKGSASLGTVSGVIGREYVWSRPPANEPRKVSKPPKLSSSDFPSSALWGEKDNSDKARKEVMHQDVAEFLYNMLDGFNLDMRIIQDVVGQCGFDVKRSMEKLLDLSEAAFKEDDIPSKKSLEKKLDQGLPNRQETSSSRAKLTTSNRKNSSAAENTRDLGKEIIGSLFNCSIRVDETETVPQVQRTMRPRVFGTPVTHPPKEITETRSFVTKVSENAPGDDETDTIFEELKQASKIYWSGMKEYYKLAVEAYVAGDSESTHKYMEQGHSFMKRARDADEQAAQMLTETRDDNEYLSIDLQAFEPREVVRLMKIQLTSLSGIEAFQYLKLVVRGNDEDPLAARRKRVIIKLLERESIGWSEEDSGKIIVIPLGHIDPKKFSFAK